ncbi:MAG: pantetheine-phosphate adenylyltransferase [Verrucomicrobiota bacterium]
MKLAIYPGSFDPIHNGHLDVIERATRLWDKVIVAVAVNRSKTGLFAVEERVGLIEQATAHLEGIEVSSFDGLLVNFFQEREADVILRGIRAVSDFEYEFQMALMNRSLEDELDTVFMMPTQENIYLSSRIVKEVAACRGDIAQHVPEVVEKALREKI